MTRRAGPAAAAVGRARGGEGAAAAQPVGEFATGPCDVASGAEVFDGRPLRMVRWLRGDEREAVAEKGVQPAAVGEHWVGAECSCQLPWSTRSVTDRRTVQGRRATVQDLAAQSRDQLRTGDDEAPHQIAESSACGHRPADAE